MFITQTSPKGRSRADEDLFSMNSIALFFGEINNGSSDPFLHSSYSLIWVREGSAGIWIDDHELNIMGGMVYFLRPGQRIALVEQDGIEGKVFSFTREFLMAHEQHSLTMLNQTLFNSLSILPGVVLMAGMAEMINRLADCMIDENDTNFRSEVLSGMLRICIIYLARKLFQNGNQSQFRSRPAVVVDQFYLLVDQKYMTFRSVGQYARNMNLSANYLNAIVKSISGFSASHHIQQRLILEVKRRTLQNDASMKEIAYELGFYDPAHFSKYFKNITGKTFSDYRRSREGGISSRFVSELRQC